MKTKPRKPKPQLIVGGRVLASTHRHDDEVWIPAHSYTPEDARKLAAYLLAFAKWRESKARGRDEILVQVVGSRR